MRNVKAKIAVTLLFGAVAIAALIKWGPAWILAFVKMFSAAATGGK